ncbi:hypothetical protein [Pleionea sp. CnH1-48]|uniref:hypothetical protein n=1 Tax=Pleionea sp. CnH1-48 TaxID=2954494 RepID=UPI002096889B|nr:hypothetical protein [Pleionea sp. CnH1-48]MCO7227152.1 hypothetical protein [Pleionea sp. CnH1-48]
MQNVKSVSFTLMTLLGLSACAHQAERDPLNNYYSGDCVGEVNHSWSVSIDSKGESSRSYQETCQASNPDPLESLKDPVTEEQLKEKSARDK